MNLPKTFPQLRVRSEYSFRRVFGPVPKVVEALKGVSANAAAIVDTHGTWGHVQWEKALAGSDIKPLFGSEFDISGKKAWAIAKTNLPDFYNFSSHYTDDESYWKNASGIIRFAGSGLTDPETFDYIDINPLSISKSLAAVRLSEETGKPLIVTGHNDYPSPDDRMRYLVWNDGKRMTPQHILSAKELWNEFAFLPEDVRKKAFKNTIELGELLEGLKLPVAPLISFDGDLDALIKLGKKERTKSGRIPKWTKEYTDRLKKEIKLIKDKKFESYFLVVSDLVRWAKTKMLVGPARGSSAGSLVCFLLQITEVDPIPNGLIFERFIDVNRLDFPDIDIDFSDSRRELVFDYLAERYGKDCVSRIGSINKLKSRSVLAHAGKKLGIPKGATFSITNVLIEYSSGDARFGKGLEDTLLNTQPGRDFTVRYPEAKIMGDIENHASHTGVHAAGVIVCNFPVTNFCTVREGVAQIDKKEAEHLNLLKIDALGLRTLGVIEDTGCITADELYNLKLDDPEVLKIFDEGKFSGIFQFEGASQRRVAAQIGVTSFSKIDHITALARPGPFGGGAAQSYTARNRGDEPITYLHPEMEAYLGETLGVVLYQEQVMRIVREIGEFSWEETSGIRKAMSGRKGKEFFDLREIQFRKGTDKRGISPELSHKIWENICSFGAWGMNKSHTTSYAMISYWCAYMKRYHKLEYAAACLRRAKDDEQVVEILRDFDREGVQYVPFDKDLSEAEWTVKDGKLVGGFTNLIGVGKVKAENFMTRRNGEGFTKKDIDFLEKAESKFKNLYPGRAMWRDVYENPDKYNVLGKVKEIADLEDKENCCVIVKLVKVDRRDENEQVRIAKRGKRWNGPSLFLDAHVVDDSISKPIVARLQIKDWVRYGELMADRSEPGADWFLIRGRWLGTFSMLSVNKIKCLTKPEMFIR